MPNEALTYASARHDTPYAEASVMWRRKDEQLFVEIVIPVGAKATVHLPSVTAVVVGHGRHSWTTVDPCTATPKHQIATVRDLIDSSQLWPQAVELLVRHGLCIDAADLANQAAPYF